MIKNICQGVFRFEIEALRKKLSCLVPKVTNLTQLTQLFPQCSDFKSEYTELCIKMMNITEKLIQTFTTGIAACAFWADFCSSRWPREIGPTTENDGAAIPPPILFFLFHPLPKAPRGVQILLSETVFSCLISFPYGS